MKKGFVYLLLILGLVVGPAVTAPAEESVTVYSVPKSESAKAAEYWTPERMRKAKPHKMPVRPEKPASSRDPGKEEIQGESGMDPGGMPGEKSLKRQSKPAMEPGVEKADATADGYKYPPPQNTFAVPKEYYKTYPYMAVGKVFFVEDGEDNVCSASSIGGRAVITAGHCVSDEKGHFYKNWVFVPAYIKEGKTPVKPYGTWPATDFILFGSYHKGGDMGRDVAFAVTENNDKGEKLSDVVGYLGFAYNKSRVQHWNMFGYPAVKPFDGSILYQSQASYADKDDSVEPTTMGMGTTQTGGCSGGPWILEFTPLNDTDGNYVFGVNSYAYGKQPKLMYAPYFDDEVKRLKDQAIAK